MRQLVSLLDYLRRLGVAPQLAAPAAVTPLDRLIESYRRFLLDERGLAPETASNYVAVAWLFLPEFCDHERVDWSRVAQLSEAMGFVTRECAPGRPGSAKNLITGLRALPRYAQWEGLTSLSLAQAVPSAAGWSGSGLPRGLRPGEASRQGKPVLIRLKSSLHPRSRSGSFFLVEISLMMSSFSPLGATSVSRSVTNPY